MPRKTLYLINFIMEDIELAACRSTGGELYTFPVDSAQWESAKWVANNLHK